MYLCGLTDFQTRVHGQSWWEQMEKQQKKSSTEKTQKSEPRWLRKDQWLPVISGVIGSGFGLMKVALLNWFPKLVNCGWIYCGFRAKQITLISLFWLVNYLSGRLCYIFIIFLCLITILNLFLNGFCSTESPGRIFLFLQPII